MERLIVVKALVEPAAIVERHVGRSAVGGRRFLHKKIGEEGLYCRASKNRIST